MLLCSITRKAVLEKYHMILNVWKGMNSLSIPSTQGWVLNSVLLRVPTELQSTDSH